MLSFLSRIAVRDKLRQEFSNIDSGFPFILLGLLGRLAGETESFGADVGMTKKTMNKFIKKAPLTYKIHEEVMKRAGREWLGNKINGRWRKTDSPSPR